VEPFLIVLILGIFLKTLLDFFSLVRQSYIFDILYGMLFIVIGIIMLMKDAHDIFGYVSIVAAVGWGGYGLRQYVKHQRM
jgi:hypothetical protein